MFRDGFIQEGIWKVCDDKHPIQLFDTADNPLYLKPGNTWIIIASTQTTLDSVVDGKWEMKFALP